MEYAIPYHRKLELWEKCLLDIILKKSKPEWTRFVDDLNVIGRCGCGKCPTILLGLQEDKLIVPNQQKVADFQGLDKQNNLIGITVFGNNFPSEMDFWSIDGNSDLNEELEINLDSISELK